MPPFCIGTAAAGRRRLRHPGGSARRARGHRHRLRASGSRRRRRRRDLGEHGRRPRHGAAAADAVRRRHRAAGDPDLHQLGRHTAGAAAPGRARSAPRSGRTWRRWTSGCWSSDPVGCPMIRRCPTLATAPPAALDRIVHGEPMTTEQRQARQAAVMEAAREFAARREPAAAAQPRLGPRVPGICSTPIGSPRSTAGPTAGSPHEAGNSAHEVRTWVAAFAALAAQGAYETGRPLLPRRTRADRGLRRPDGGAARDDQSQTSLRPRPSTSSSSAPAAAA